MIMADNGSSIYISGDPEQTAGTTTDLGTLKTVPASAFEVLLIDPLYTPHECPHRPRSRSSTASTLA